MSIKFIFKCTASSGTYLATIGGPILRLRRMQRIIEIISNVKYATLEKHHSEMLITPIEVGFGEFAVVKTRIVLLFLVGATEIVLFATYIEPIL